MDTPICDFVRRYAGSGAVRLHMPGHKGVSRLGCESLDITEIPGADTLYGASGIIAESEAHAAERFGSGLTRYATEGSSQCVRAMLHLARLGWAPASGRPVILAGRNVHQSFVHACALLDLDAAWLMPEGGGSLCACPVSPAQVDAAIRRESPFAVYLTAPDYLGGSPDLAAIARVCRDHGVPLLVDNAHGAYLKFLTPSRHPLDLGAAMCCDSAHKTLPVLTGGAYLHLSREAAERVGGQADSALALFGSTSPSYLTLQSLDLCNRLLAEGWPERLRETAAAMDDLKDRLAACGYTVFPSDPLRLTLSGQSRGYDGPELADALRRAGLECEYAQRDRVVCMVTPDNPPEDLRTLERTLADLPRRAPRELSAAPPLPAPVRRLTIRQAALADAVAVPLDQAAGRICADPAVSCPPAVPVAVSGEELTPEVLRVFAYYGYPSVRVVRNAGEEGSP